MAGTDFIRSIVAEDLASGKHERIVTRFPPEPNGHMHIGHAKAILLNYWIATENSGQFNLRFDDTNPVREEEEYVDAIKTDIAWLGCDWKENLFFASDYFEQLFDWGVQLVKAGKAFVDDQTAKQIRDSRGTLTEPGANSPRRDRPIDENLDLFLRMRAGEFEDGSKVLRAKIDMASPNLNLRDPVLYRILRATHHRTGDDWCIYPMYDWAHGQSDSIEGITHSLCSLEFENHRPLYDWCLEALGVYAPRQIEFARLNLSYTITSKRKLRQLVEDGTVAGWDDPRMPSLSALRRRGYTAEAIRAFIQEVGVAKRGNVVELARLEHHIRDHLNKSSPRVMAVLDPLKVIIENYPEDEVEEFDAVNNPEDESAGTRKVPFCRELYIERGDFLEDPPRKFFRLAPGREVRLRCAYFVTCTDVVKDENGEIVQLRCTYDEKTRGGDAPDGRKVKATMHWVSARHALEAEVRLYDNLFSVESPKDMQRDVQPDSLDARKGCRIEPSVRDATPGTRYQFERNGYFCVDPDSGSDGLVFNRTVTLRDTWKRIQQQQQGKPGTKR